MMGTRTARGLIQDSLLGDALAHAEVGAFVIDPTGHYVAANAEACAITGYTQDDIHGIRVGELNPESDLAEQFDEVAARRRDEGRVEIERKDGERILVGYRVVRTTVAGVPYVLALVWRVD